MVSAALKSQDESLDNALRFLREGVKLSNARLSTPRPLTRKDYLAGKAYIGWKEAISHPDGNRYEASFAVRRLEGSFDEHLAVGKADPHVQHCLGGNHDLVLVRYIEALDSKEGAIPSTMWLGLSHQAGGFFTGAGAGDLLSDRILEFCEVADDREIASGGVAVVGDRTCSDEVVKRGSKIVNRIPNDQRYLRRQSPPRPDPVAVKLRHWVDFGPGEVGVAVKKSVPGRLEISDVAFRSMKL